MYPWTRRTAVLAAGLLVAGLSACGGSSTPSTPSTPAPTPIPTPKPPYVVSQLQGVSLTAGDAGYLPFSTTEAGALDATVQWTYDTNDLDVYLAKGNCNGTNTGTADCNFIAYSESTTAKPEKVHADNTGPGPYAIFVYNVGPGDETLSFQVVLSPSGTGSVPPSASSRADEGISMSHRPRAFVELH
jgi:hypothetical protein